MGSWMARSEVRALARSVLTERQLACLQLRLSGHTSGRIAAELGISKNRVRDTLLAATRKVTLAAGGRPPVRAAGGGSYRGRERRSGGPAPGRA
jgi:DNA-binding CsgD family transcriptional regulator